MKTCYYKTLTPTKLAVLDICDAGGIEGAAPGDMWISRINVPEPFGQRSHGRDLLRECLADADAEGVTIHLTINAYGRLSHGDLAAWYRRWGFVENDGLFTRQPKK